MLAYGVLLFLQMLCSNGSPVFRPGDLILRGVLGLQVAFAVPFSTHPWEQASCMHVLLGNARDRAHAWGVMGLQALQGTGCTREPNPDLTSFIQHLFLPVSSDCRHDWVARCGNVCCNDCTRYRCFLLVQGHTVLKDFKDWTGRFGHHPVTIRMQHTNIVPGWRALCKHGQDK